MFLRVDGEERKQHKQVHSKRVVRCPGFCGKKYKSVPRVEGHIEYCLWLDVCHSEDGDCDLLFRWGRRIRTEVLGISTHTMGALPGELI